MERSRVVDAQHRACEAGDHMTVRPSIIIVNWNTRGLLARCVADVRRHTPAPFELVLVDNGSIDGSVDVARSLAGAATKVVLLPENRGFACGNNAGLAVADHSPFIKRAFIEQALGLRDDLPRLARR